MNKRIDAAYHCYSSMVDLPKFLREIKCLKVVMIGLLSAEQHKFSNWYAEYAMGDDADDIDDFVSEGKKVSISI
jgi:hypothetical protein